MSTVFSVKDSESMEAWIAKANELSDSAYEVMKDTAAIVTEIKNESAGSLADEMVALGNSVLTQAKKVTDVMEKVSSAIRSFFDKLTNFVDGMVGTVKSMTGGLGG